MRVPLAALQHACTDAEVLRRWVGKDAADLRLVYTELPDGVVKLQLAREVPAGLSAVALAAIREDCRCAILRLHALLKIDAPFDAQQDAHDAAPPGRYSTLKLETSPTRRR